MSSPLKIEWSQCAENTITPQVWGLWRSYEQALGLNPFDTALYVFINRQRTKIKILYWHRNGFCLWLKRLESEKFAWPRDDESLAQELTSQELEWLLEGFDLWKNKPHKTLNFASVS